MPDERLPTINAKRKTGAFSGTALSDTLRLKPNIHRRRPARHLAQTVAPLDQRTRIGRDSAKLRRALFAHCGNKPSPVQQALIELAAQLHLRCMVMDARFAESGDMSSFDAKLYLAWSNSLGRALVRLGLKGIAERGPSLRDYIASAAPSARPGRPRRRARLLSSLDGPEAEQRPSLGDPVPSP